MKVETDSINKELRLVGTVAKAALGSYDEKKLKLMSVATRLIFSYRGCPGLRADKVEIEREDGTKLRLFIYRPSKSGTNLPGVVWIHGGGFVMGTSGMDLSFVRSMVKKTPCVVVSPEYALSVERPYPAAIDDCYRALSWLRANSSALGVRDDKLIVGGESAGGGLCAALTLMARDKGEHRLAFQMPLYPMLDDRMETESMKDNDAPMWNARSNAPAWKLYLGELYGTENVPKYAAPARETDYAQLPPAYSYVGSVDPFRDETVAYFENLREAGVVAKLDVYDGCFHGFDVVCPLSKIAEEAKTRFLDEFQYAVDNYCCPQSDS